jgi:hypothetical protein
MLDGGIGYSVTKMAGATYLEGIEVQIEPDRDLDGDGLTAEDELVLGTDPNNPDTDGDGMTDGWETSNGLDPLHADAGDDPDGDGMTNLQEFIAGTDPRGRNSRLDVAAVVKTGGVLDLRWSAVPGKAYRIQVKDSVQQPYRELEDPSLPRRAISAMETFVIKIPEGSRSQYYRVVVLPE